MNINITQPALKWFQEEMEVTKGDCIRFFARFGGHSQVQTGFSIGIAKEDPHDPITSYEQDGVRFFIENADAWFLDQHNLLVKYNKKFDEIQFEFQSEQE